MIQGPGFLVIPQESGEGACSPGISGAGYLRSLVDQASHEADVDPDFAVVLTAQPLTCPRLYYVPEKNDIEGIGYKNLDGQELFDEAPNAARQGIVFLNDLPYWLDNPNEFRSDFLHEMGHRWLSHLQAETAEKQRLILSTDDGHWSYFLDSAGSPMGGNSFSPSPTSKVVPPEAVTTTTRRDPSYYSALDLYAMGALAPDDVGPLRLLTNASSNARDCNSAAISDSSESQWCEPADVAGTFQDLSMDDVIRAHGERSPASSQAPKEFTVAFIVLVGSPGWSRAHCDALTPLVEERIEDFRAATGGLLTLKNAVTQGSACEQLPLAPAAASSGCALVSAPSSKPPWAILLIGAAACLFLQRRRHSPLLPLTRTGRR